MEAHSAASIFPMMGESEIAALAEDIRLNGQRQPIIIFNRLVLDGRNRIAACKLLGIKPITQSLIECPSPTAYVVSANLMRRHLTSAQRTAVALEAEKCLAAEAVLRQRAAGVCGQLGGRGHKNPSPLIGGKGLGKSGEATRQAAELAQVGHNQVEQLKATVKIAPELLEEVRDGRLKVAEAAAMATLDVSSRQQAIEAIVAGMKPREAIRQVRQADRIARHLAEPSGTYRVIYADPPWQYGDERTGLSGYEETAAADHYPTMATAAICALHVRDWADSDAVLFCWATFPLLPDALDVVKAWGFKYKTAFVWAKGRAGGLGHYHDTSCELLLVATRGSCTPDVAKREQQLQQIPRLGKHSAKPEEIRLLIERLYPHGRRLELFRRGKAPRGWNVWGNETT